jgi:hypothetical protein
MPFYSLTQKKVWTEDLKQSGKKSTGRFEIDLVGE